MSHLVSSFFYILLYLFSCVGDDRELRAVEWRHWRMAAGELTLHNSCTHCIWQFDRHHLKGESGLWPACVTVLYLTSFRNVWHTLATIWENRPLLQTKKKKMWVLCMFFVYCLRLFLCDDNFRLKIYCWPHSPSVPASCSHLRWICPMCIWPTQRRACGSH